MYTRLDPHDLTRGYQVYPRPTSGCGADLRRLGEHTNLEEIVVRPRILNDTKLNNPSSTVQPGCPTTVKTSMHVGYQGHLHPEERGFDLTRRIYP